jgi:hypothetical protein
MMLVASYQTAVVVPKSAPKPDISNAAAVKKALLAAKADAMPPVRGSTPSSSRATAPW